MKASLVRIGCLYFFWVSIQCFRGAKDWLCTIPFQFETTDIFFSKLASVSVSFFFSYMTLEMYLILETAHSPQGGEWACSKSVKDPTTLAARPPCLHCPVSQWIEKYVTPSTIRCCFFFLIQVGGALPSMCIVLMGNIFFIYDLPMYEEVFCLYHSNSELWQFVI